MRRPLIGGEDFKVSIGQREQAQGKVMEAYEGRGKFLGLGKGKRKRKNVRKKKKKISYIVWKGVVNERDVCKN
jgi:hypothetical protein